nr:unnamed protein product [Digitaria exilis]
MLLRGGRRAALLLSVSAAASVAGAGALARRDPDTAVYASASPPLRHALSAAAEGLLSGTRLFSPWPLPPPYQGFPIINSFASASVSPAKLSDQGSAGISDDSRCGPGCLGRNSIAKAASAVGPAVVNISCTQDAHGWLLKESIGSGTIIDPDGTILTCAHVVADFQSTKAVVRGKVSVTLQDGREFEGVVLNADRHSDIAVVKIKSKPRYQLPGLDRPLDFSQVIGLSLWAVRFHFRIQLQLVLSVALTGKAVIWVLEDYEGSICKQIAPLIRQIHFLCGNSGGPLVNLDGEIIGVNVMKVRNADGLSFAVPIDSVVKIVDNFKKNGRVVRPWLGLKMLDLNPMIISQLKEKSSTFPDVRKGVLVPMVTPGSPAEQAGFRPGDVVVEFGGRSVESIKEVTKITTDTLISFLRQIIDIMGDKVGVPFKVLVKRANNVTVTLTVIPDDADASR